MWWYDAGVGCDTNSQGVRSMSEQEARACKLICMAIGLVIFSHDSVAHDVWLAPKHLFLPFLPYLVVSSPAPLGLKALQRLQR